MHRGWGGRGELGVKKGEGGDRPGPGGKFRKRPHPPGKGGEERRGRGGCPLKRGGLLGDLAGPGSDRCRAFSTNGKKNRERKKEGPSLLKRPPGGKNLWPAKPCTTRGGPRGSSKSCRRRLVWGGGGESTEVSIGEEKKRGETGPNGERELSPKRLAARKRNC